jgi:hypothetical protein
MYDPGVSDDKLPMVRVLVFPGITGLGLKELVIPPGPSKRVKVTVSANSAIDPIDNVKVASAGGQADPFAGMPSRVKLSIPSLIGKSTSEISKNILSVHFTMTLQVFENPGGNVTEALPLFGTDDAIVSVKATPPSYESKMSTLVQFMGDAVVFATSHVTVSVLPSVNVSAVLGAVTRKGPEEADVVTTISSSSVHPAML